MTTRDSHGRFAKAAGSPAPAKTDPFSELSNSGLYSKSGAWEYARAEFLPELRGRNAARTYREMARNDGIVGGILFGVEGVIRSINWTLDPARADGEQPTPEAEELAAFVESCMSDMSMSWGDFISEVLTMLVHGYSYLEVVYKRRLGPDQEDGSKRSDHDDGRVGWRKFVQVGQDTIVDWLVDETGGIQAAVQQAGGSTKVPIPIDKAVMFKTNRSNPWGQSILRAAYIPYYYRKRIQETEGIGVERDLAGLPVIYAHPDYLAVNRETLRQMVTAIRRDEQEGVLLPDIRDASGNRVVELTLLSSAGSRQFDTNTIIARYTREIAMSVLQDVLLLGHEKVGTQALAREKRDLSDTALKQWIDEIANVMNRHAIPRLLKLNGLDLRLAPRLVPGDIRDDDLAQLAATLLSLSNAGFGIAGDPAMEEWVRDRFGLPEVSEDTTPEEPLPEEEPELEPEPEEPEAETPEPDEDLMPDVDEETPPEGLGE